MSPREALVRRLGESGKLTGSYLPGRSGFTIESVRPLEELRADLMPKLAVRLTVLHLPSGRFFLEPSREFLTRSLLETAKTSPWWSPAHARASETFFLPWRADRVRRLPRLQRAPVEWRAERGYLALRALALRLEALPYTPKPDKHWAGLARAFDDLWRGARLYQVPPSRLGVATFNLLRSLARKSAAGLQGE